MFTMLEHHTRPVLPDVEAAMVREPFLWISLRDGRPEAIGTPAVRLGQVNLPTPLQTGHDVFAEWHWDGREVVIRNCRLGHYPIYYYAAEKMFGVSPSIEHLLAQGAPADLDDAAMAIYLRLGWTLGVDTVFRSIRALPPGATVRWSGGQAQVSGGINHLAPLHSTREEAIANFSELVRQAVRRRASRDVPYVMPLSGGRDSRHILLELCELGCRPEVCITNHDFPPYRTQNIEAARLVAQRLGLPHVPLGQPTSRLKAELAKNRLNNFGASENAWCVSLYSEIGRRYSNPIVYEGSHGITYFGPFVTPDLVQFFESGRIEDAAYALVNRWLNWQSSEDALQRVFTREAAIRFPLDLAVERLKTELEEHRNAANPTASFYFWNRGRFVSAMQPFSIASRLGVKAVTPFLDHDLVDFLLALPPRINIDKAFEDHGMHEKYPLFQDIPFAGDIPTPPHESNLHYRRFFLESLPYLATHGTGTFVQRGPLLRRLPSLAMSGGNLRMRMKWTAPYTALYLTQIESLLERFGTSR